MSVVHRLAVFLAFSGSGSLNAGLRGDSLPVEIRLALEANAAALTPITIDAVQRFESGASWPDTAARLGILQPPPAVFFADQTRRWSWQNSLWYSKTTYENHLRPSVEVSFDGNILYIGHPESGLHDHRRSPSLHRMTPTRLRADERHIDTEYFEGAGFQLPSRAGDLGRGTDAQSRVTAALRIGGLASLREVQLNGVPVTRVAVRYLNPDRQAAEKIDLAQLETTLRSGRNSEEYIRRELAIVHATRELPERRVSFFFLDARLGFAVRQIEDGDADGRLLTRTTNSDFVDVEGRGLWLPKRSRVDFHSWPSLVGASTPDPLVSKVFEVKGFDGGPIPLERFTLAYSQAGTDIADDVLTDEQIGFRMPAEVEDLERAVEEQRRGLGAQAWPWEESRGGPGVGVPAGRGDRHVSVAGGTDGRSDQAPAGWRSPLVLWLNVVAGVGLLALIAGRLKRR